MVALSIFTHPYNIFLSDNFIINLESAMSLVPRNFSDNPYPTLYTPFPQDFWDHFFNQDFPFPFPFRSSFPFPPFPGRTVPYSEFAVETSGDVRARLECKEVPEAHIIAADLPGFEKDEVDVAAEDGGYLRISGGGGRFSWRFRLSEDAEVHLMSSSMENGVLTVVVPKVNPESELEWGRGWGNEGRNANVRQIEIAGSDD